MFYTIEKLKFKRYLHVEIIASMFLNDQSDRLCNVQKKSNGSFETSISMKF